MSKHPGRKPSQRQWSPEARELVRIFESIVGPEKAQALLESAESILDSEFPLVLVQVSPIHRAALYSALQNAGKSLAGGKPCDVCPSTAETIRFLHATPKQLGGRLKAEFDGNHFTGFVLLCSRCAEKSCRALLRAVIRRAMELQNKGCEFGPHPLVPGVPIGEVPAGIGMPERAAIERCRGCGKAIWISQDAVERIGPRDGSPVMLCVDCVMARREDIVFAVG